MLRFIFFPYFCSLLPVLTEALQVHGSHPCWSCWLPFFHKQEPQFRPPSLVVVGFSDSGTRGVKQLLAESGLYYCDYTNGEEDNINTAGSHKYIRDLLNASGGHVNNVDGYNQSVMFPEAVDHELQGAARTRTCIAKNYKLDANDDFPWAYKNPAHLFLLPVMSAAFQNLDVVPRFLAVARDPRDICTGLNQNTLAIYGPDVLLDGVAVLDYPPKNVSKVARVQAAIQHDCPLFWAKTWSSTLAEYSKSILRVVKIEDLVLPPPERTSKSYKAMECMLNHAKLKINPEKVLGQLKELHKRRDSYGGHRFAQDAAAKASIEADFNSRTDESIIWQTMQKMGYEPSRYGSLTPTSQNVCQ